MSRLIALSTLLLLQSAWAGPVVVPAGPFQMGCSMGDSACEKDEGRPGGTRVDVRAFAIDTHEVTVEHYRAASLPGNARRRSPTRATNTAVTMRLDGDSIR